MDPAAPAPASSGRKLAATSAGGATPPYARTAVGWLAAAIGGLAGLALEVLWLAGLGPALGHGRAAPIGIGAWVAGWALGAAAAGALARRGRFPARIALGGGL